METFANINLASALTNGYHDTDPFDVTSEAFVSIQVVKTTGSEPDAEISIIPMVSIDETNYAPVMDNNGKLVKILVPFDAEIVSQVPSASMCYTLEPVRAVKAKIRIVLGRATSGIISLYVKTAMAT